MKAKSSDMADSEGMNLEGMNLEMRLSNNTRTDTRINDKITESRRR